MDQNDLNAQRAEDSNIEENIREVLRAKNLAIDCDDKDLVPKVGNILQDSAELR